MKTEITVTLKVEVENYGVDTEWLKQHIDSSIRQMIGDGGLTGSSEAECRSWELSMEATSLTTIADLNYHIFPNGKAWRVDANGCIEGSVYLESSQDETLEGHLDQISEAATGSTAGLTGFSWRPLGNSMYFFRGSVAEMLQDEEDTIIRVTEMEELLPVLEMQYKLSQVELEHLQGSLFNVYPNESSLKIAGGRSLNFPAYPEPVSYVRVTMDGLELAYWVEDEFRDAPAEVLGALLGAARGAQS